MIPRRVALATAMSGVASLIVACGGCLHSLSVRRHNATSGRRPLSYDADTTLGEVGLAHFGGDHVEVRAWITDVAVPYEDPRAPEIVDTRLICVEVIDQDVADPNLYLTVPFPATPCSLALRVAGPSRPHCPEVDSRAVANRPNRSVATATIDRWIPRPSWRP